jgi:hypothetical protein
MPSAKQGKIYCYNCSGGTIVLSLEEDGKVMLTDANVGLQQWFSC